MDLTFRGAIWFWKGPAPWYFVTVPPEQAEVLAAAAKYVSYGWGMIPVRARVGTTTWTTSLFPKAGSYVLPLRTDVRKAEGLAEDDVIDVALEIQPASRA